MLHKNKKTALTMPILVIKITHKIFYAEKIPEEISVEISFVSYEILNCIVNKYEES